MNETISSLITAAFILMTILLVTVIMQGVSNAQNKEEFYDRIEMIQKTWTNYELKIRREGQCRTQKNV